MWPSQFNLRQPEAYCYVFVASLLLSLALCRLIIWGCHRFGVVDNPGRRKIHAHPTALLGGVAIYLAFALAVVSLYHYSYQMIGIVIGGLPVMLIGALDDICQKQISATVKFLTLVLVTLVLVQYGVVVELFVPLLGGTTGWAWLQPVLVAGDVAVTLLWIVGVTSALNAVDNMNGLASGVAMVACAAFAVVAFTTAPVPEFFMALLALALVGATMGFLFFNFRPKARMFLGDSGSFFLGYAVASMGVLGQWSAHPFIGFVIPALVLAVPIFDLCFVVVTRHACGTTSTLREALSHCDTDHLSHRLLALGLSRTGAVLCLWLMACILAVGGILLRNSTDVVNSMLLIGQAFLILGLFGFFLWRHTHQARVEPPARPGKRRSSGVDIVGHSAPMPRPTQIELTLRDKA